MGRGAALMYIENPRRSYTRDGQQRTRAALFLILVDLGMTDVLETCKECHGTGQGVREGMTTPTPCNHCTRIKCELCGGKGWTYNEATDEHAKQCEPCKGSGDLGPSGMARRFIFNKEIRALVRRVALHQLGHFMMGQVTILGHDIPISGTYGSDGLPRSVPQEVFDIAVPIPQELHDAWNKGGGWNSAGSEAQAMVDWARVNLDKLNPRKGRSKDG